MSEASYESFDLSALAANSGIAELEYRPELGSTNDFALEIAADESRNCPLLVLTTKQTAGRGRGANRWWGSEGSLTFSLVIDRARWSISQESLPALALTAGVAVCETLAAEFPAGVFGLKWPNDVFLNGKKLCGILVEMPSHARSRIVVGIGVNVNNSFDAAPPELKSIATALCDEAGGTFEATELLTSMIRTALSRFDRFGRGESPAAAFERFCLLTGRAVEIGQGSESIVGKCLGIDSGGRLRLQTASGEQAIHSGIVRMF